MSFFLLFFPLFPQTEKGDVGNKDKGKEILHVTKYNRVNKVKARVDQLQHKNFPTIPPVKCYALCPHSVLSIF